jgi:NAD(P)-dependent dehydrogenase (short-subunit alcohol dehydrogenase family)
MADPFAIHDRVAVVTGGYGVLGGTIAADLAAAGARVAILGRRLDAAQKRVDEIAASEGQAIAVMADALDETSLRSARDEVLRAWGRIDILINAAGGNVAAARSDNRPVFEVPMPAFDEVLKLNLHGSVLPSMVLGETMVEHGGTIVNISSMASFRVLTGVLGYSIAKAGIDTFTRWLATDLARRYGDRIRVNAIAPGFFLSEQNRAVLIGPDGQYTDRARKVIEHTPMGRLGRPEELTGAVRWLCSDAASFVTGAVIPIDGGFSVFSGV